MPRCTQCGESILNPRISLDFPSLQARLRSAASVQSEEVVSILKSVELDLEDFDAEIARLEHRILLLNTLKERHREHGNQVKTLLSPIRKLPDELLCEVFDLCCGMNHFFVTDLSSESAVSTAFTFKSAPAMALSNVCFRWRRNALAMPSIWSRIALGSKVEMESEGPHRDSDNRKFPLGLSLARSLSQPLTIELDMTVSDPDWFLSISHSEELAEQSHRWQKLTLFETQYYSLEDLLGGSGHFPLLEDVELHEHESSSVHFLVGKAPNLKKLTWGGGSWYGHSRLPASISTNTFPQMAHIGFYIPLNRSSLLENFLKANPNLISLTLDGEAEDKNSFFEEEYMTSPSTCPRMETLSVRNSVCFIPVTIFSAMCCPSLKSLHLSSEMHAQWSNHMSFLAFVQRSSFPLTTLSMENLLLSDSDLVYLLHHVPTLMNLSVHDIDTTDKDAENLNPLTERFINSLHAYQTSSLRSNFSPIVPRLRSLTLSCGARKFNDAAVIDMVKSRWFPGTLSGALSDAEAWNLSPFYVDCLREFTLNFRARKKVDSAVYAPLEQLEKNGMRAVVLWALT